MRHNIDSVMASMWNFYRTRFLALFLISLVMSLIIQYASSFVNFQELSTTTDPNLLLDKIRELILPILAISLLNIILNAVFQHYVIFNPLDTTNNILTSGVKIMRYMIPYLIIMVLLAFFAALALVLGILLFFVGAIFSVIYIMNLYFLILPVMLVEKSDIGNTITRTFSLMHRNFWINMGWVAIFIIIILVLSVLTSGLILLPFTGNFIKGIMNPAEASDMINLIHNPLFIGLSALAGAITLPLVPIFASILYFNGVAREEVVTETIDTDQENRPVRVEDLYAKPYSDDHPENPENKERTE
jgi:hypothetical protein